MDEKSLEEGRQHDSSMPASDAASEVDSFAIGSCPRLEQIKTADSARPPSRLVKDTILAGTLSRVRTSDSIPIGPPPDGGFRAWSHSLLVHLIILVTWGNINSFGAFQSYYTQTLHEEPSAISWIGGVQTFLTFFIGTFSGRALDAGFYKLTFCIGTVIQVLGIFMTSISKTYWQVFLSQGICQGLGNGLVFVPSMALMSTYFSSHKGLAIGIAASGSATGGMIFPAIVESLLPKVGFGWTVRVIGLVALVVMIICAIFMKPRLPPRKSGPLVEWSAFHEGTYLLFSLAAFLFFWGIYTGYYYVTSYARDRLGVSYTDSLNILLVMNGVGLPSRIIPTYISDRYTGPLNAFLFAAIVASTILYSWAAVHSVPGIWAFAVFYGIAGAIAQGLLPVAITSLTKDQSKAGVRMGMIFSVVAFATLTGPAISGALITKDGGGYLYTQIFTGTTLLVGCGFLVGARWVAVGWRVRAKL